MHFFALQLREFTMLFVATIIAIETITLEVFLQKKLINVSHLETCRLLMRPDSFWDFGAL